MKLWSSVVGNLQARLQLLDADFQAWLEKSAPTGKLKQHHSQVRRITGILNGVIKATFQNTPFSNTAATPDLNLLPDLRRSVGSVHVIWDFFRDKFAQRDVANVATHLGVADDFAWELYRPFLDAASKVGLGGKSISEPPLVFYSPYRSPYAQARTKQYEPPGIDAKDFKQFVDVLIKLPIPVIGVPWGSANRLPDLVVVGHETGHVVAEDLGLAQEAKELIANLALQADANAERKKCWESWIDEVFADIFGVLATGTAFVAGLAGEMAGDRAEVRQAKINRAAPGDYPTAALRMALCEAVLTKFSVTPDTSWSQAYDGLAGDSRSFQGDVPLIVDALIDRKWAALGDKKLGDLLPWNTVLEDRAKKIASSSLAITDPSVPFSVRTWIAGAMLASLSDPPKYNKDKLDSSMASRIVSQRQVQVRSIHTESIRTRALANEGVAEPDPLQVADEQLGYEIAKSLGLLKL